MGYVNSLTSKIEEGTGLRVVNRSQSIVSVQLAP